MSTVYPVTEPPSLCFGPEYITLSQSTPPEYENYYLETTLLLPSPDIILQQDTIFTLALNGRTFPLASDPLNGLSSIGAIFVVSIANNQPDYVLNRWWTLSYQFAYLADTPITSVDPVGPFAVDLNNYSGYSGYSAYSGIDPEEQLPVSGYSGYENIKLRAQWTQRRLTVFVNDVKLNSFNWVEATFDAPGNIAFQCRFQNPSTATYPILIDSMRACYIPYSDLPPQPPGPPPCPPPQPLDLNYVPLPN